MSPQFFLYSQWSFYSLGILPLCSFICCCVSVHLLQFVKLDSNICTRNLGKRNHSSLTASQWFLCKVNRFREGEGRKSSLGHNSGKCQDLNCSQICPSFCQTRPGLLRYFSCGSTGTRETNYLQWHFKSWTKPLVGGCSGRNYLPVSPPVTRKKCFGLEAERGTWDGPHMKDPAWLSALITASPDWEEPFHVCAYGVSSCIFVCLFFTFVLIDDSQFACGCFQFCLLFTSDVAGMFIWGRVKLDWLKWETWRASLLFLLLEWHWSF